MKKNINNEGDKREDERKNEKDSKRERVWRETKEILV